MGYLLRENYRTTLEVLSLLDARKRSWYMLHRASALNLRVLCCHNFQSGNVCRIQFVNLARLWIFKTLALARRLKQICFQMPVYIRPLQYSKRNLPRRATRKRIGR